MEKKKSILKDTHVVITDNKKGEFNVKFVGPNGEKLNSTQGLNSPDNVLKNLLSLTRFFLPKGMEQNKPKTFTGRVEVWSAYGFDKLTFYKGKNKTLLKLYGNH